MDREAELVEDHRHFVDEGDIDVALGVLDHFGRLGGPDALGGMDLTAVDGAIDRRQPLGDLRRLARDDLDDAIDGVQAIAGVDALGRIAHEKVDPRLKPGGRGDRGAADLLGDAGIDGALEHHDGALRDHAADHAAGRAHGGEVRPLVLGDRRRHGGDEELTAADRLDLADDREPASAQNRLAHLARAVVAA